MSRKFFLLAAMTFFAAVTSHAQADLRTRKAYSTAEVFGRYVTGDFRAASEAASAWTAGADASAVKHYDGYSLAGSFGFEQMEGEGMAGSMFIRPGFYPFDVYEFTPGRKTLQRYSFSGGLSVDVAPNWSIGGVISYESSNYSKRKDLRHSNYRLDMSVAPGVLYHCDAFSFGLNYIYSRNSETVNAEQIGNSTSGYQAFFDKGLYYGLQELWTGSGVHLDEAGVSGLPVHENIHGVGAEAAWDDFSLSGQWRSRRGAAGEKQTIWYRFPGWDADLTAVWASGPHRVKAGLSVLEQDSYETILDKETSGGVTLVHEYGSNLIFSRRHLSSSLVYDFNGDPFHIRAAVLLSHRYSRSSMTYPYVARQVLNMPAFEAAADRRFGRFGVSLGLHYGFGDISDRILNTSGSVLSSTYPERLERYFVKFREHMTCNQIWVFPALSYHFSEVLSVELSGRVRHGFALEYLTGSNRIDGGLALHYDF